MYGKRRSSATRRAYIAGLKAGKRSMYRRKKTTRYGKYRKW